MSSPAIAPQTESARMHIAPDFAGMELLTARYVHHRFAPHVHDTFVVALIEQGSERFRCRRAEGVANAGSIIVIPPAEVHTGQSGGESGWSYRALYPAPQKLGELMAELRDGEARLPVFDRVVFDDPALFRALQGLHAVLIACRDPLHRSCAWREAMTPLLRHAGVVEPATGCEDAAVRRAQELLRADPDAALTLDDLARAVGLSPWHLNRVFSRSVGLPPHAWRNQWRLAQAKRLLRGGLSPAEVAASLGFADQSHLHRLFKRAFGVTPGGYIQSKNVQDRIEPCR
ncbi:MAG: AraC family transcriptional regulator [Thiomonas arsenitoxydans]|uniref:AraC family transcriptional regulator n=1 Tax=Thiomonas arsenitoxydans (strain DSM 22701 / CIP 110005 / 3As) TaxID=426114 RepID=A0A8I1SWL8_THIA3|nr:MULTISPECIES: AraC family transcriptional regulator [Thiomonas]MBN8745537.1 AraC family transcriptional regulator [Thiomonas arsenitoxydans]